MGDVIAIAVVTALFAIAGGIAVVKWLPKPPPKPPPKEEARGTWHRAQETVAGREGSKMRVLLVREYEGKETGRLVVAEIDSNDHNFNIRVQEAFAEADNRQATLESGERR